MPRAECVKAFAPHWLLCLKHAPRNAGTFACVLLPAGSSRAPGNAGYRCNEFGWFDGLRNMNEEAGAQGARAVLGARERSSAENRDRERLFRSMKLVSRWPEGSIFIARRPLKSICTLCAPFCRQR